MRSSKPSDMSTEPQIERVQIEVPSRHDRASAPMLLQADLVGTCQKRPPVVFLTGGPGIPATHARAYEPFRVVIDHLAQTRRVVLLDQRGVSLSIAPLNASHDFLLAPQAAMTALVKQARATLATGIDPHAITPWQSALDVPIVARTLGVEQVDVIAYSYGTHLAMATVRARPETIRKLVLCGFEGPDQTYKLPSQFDHQLARIDGGLPEKFAAARAQLSRQPCSGLSDWGLRWIASSWFGLSDRYPYLLPLCEAILNQDLGPIDRATAGFIKMLNHRSPVYYLCDAASGASGARLQQIAREAECSLVGEVLNFPFPAIRLAWGQCDLGDTFRGPLEIHCPVLVRTGEMDGFTPQQNIADSGVQVESAQYVHLPGAAHNDLLSDPEAAAQINVFLDA